MENNINSKKLFVDELEPEVGPNERGVDQAWCSELCKSKVLSAVINRHPCTQRFARMDVIPLYAADFKRFYRVTLWVNDWSTDSYGPIKQIWKTFYVTLEGIERNVVSIKENRKRNLLIGEKGLKLMDELRDSDMNKK